jgi:hypothetical protein
MEFRLPPDPRGIELRGIELRGIELRGIELRGIELTPGSPKNGFYGSLKTGSA